MIRRTCACGAVIVCADLDGWAVWLDNHPTDDGMFRVVAGHDAPWVVVDPAGPYRRHTCHVDQPESDPHDDRRGRDRTHLAADRAIPAVQAVIAAGTPLTAEQRQAARLRLAHPTESYRQLARRAGVSKGAFDNALRGVMRHATNLTQQAA
ncbi:hypothetical protein Drose_06420 [Dactylosporangium roseum]|uniref:RNA polymerase sigma factor 70 region 4 type 2 domain-containing protein n=1 Tax=Dactylosporangium roseum TaxID=47989 RepID=A0ABY5Z7S8_9ACTN|nr:hypothetical protein [Dactylosporangium roseum]UWZ37907.1 hypothetical protein Drose_06420 [Dactylosporangium roseum]